MNTKTTVIEQDQLEEQFAFCDKIAAIWQTCGYTGFVASGDSRYDTIRELTVFGVGD